MTGIVRRVDLEMHIGDGAEFGRRGEARQQAGGEVWRHRQDDFVVPGEIDRVAAEIEARRSRAIEVDAVQLVPELHRGAM